MCQRYRLEALQGLSVGNGSLLSGCLGPPEEAKQFAGGEALGRASRRGEKLTTRTYTEYSAVW